MVGGSAESRILQPLAARGGVRGGATEARPASGWVEIRRDPDPGERLGREGEGCEARNAGRDGGGPRAQHNVGSTCSGGLHLVCHSLRWHVFPGFTLLRLQDALQGNCPK